MQFRQQMQYCHSAMLSQFGTLLPRLPSVRMHVQGRPAASVCVSDWAGLQAWRSAPLNEHRWWQGEGPAKWEPASESTHSDSVLTQNSSFCGERGTESSRDARCVGCGIQTGACLAPDDMFHGSLSRLPSLAGWGALVLSTSCPHKKAFLTHHAFQLWYGGNLPLGVATAPDTPARPAKPELVHPREVPLLTASPLPQSAHVLHNLAHIELNAVNLAWDTVVRFSTQSEELGLQFFADFAHVADDESRHLGWCLQRLKELGYSYGDIPAHNLLWKDCAKTSGNIQARLAVIPMTQEARGLDAGPRLVEKLMAVGDEKTASIVQKIVDEELAHVAVGVSWFRAICSRLRVNPAASFKAMMEDYNVQVRGPFNYQARAEAGLPREWFDSLSRSDELDTTVKKKRSRGKRAKAEQVEGQTAESAVQTTDVMVARKSAGGNVHPEMLKVKERLAIIVAMENDNTEL